MKEFIEAINSGDLVGVKKHFASIMEDRTESLRQELRVQIAEEIRIEGETDDEDDEADKDDKSGKDKKENPDDKGDTKPEEKE